MTGQRLFERVGMDTDQPGGRDVRLAWLCLIVLPLFFLFAFAVGEGLSALLGHPDGTGTEVSGSDILLTTVPALIVFALPAIVAAAAAHPAARQGNRRGWIPAGILITIALAFAVLNLVPMGQ